MFLCERQSLFSVSWPFSHTDRIQLMFWIASVTWLGLSQTSAVEIFGKRSILDGWNGPESPLSFISKVHGWPNFTYNPGQNTWSKIKKSSKIGQNLKILISAFELFWPAIVKVLFLKRRLGFELYLHIYLRLSRYLVTP